MRRSMDVGSPSHRETKWLRDRPGDDAGGVDVLFESWGDRKLGQLRDLGHDVVGLVRLCEAGIALDLCQLRPDHDIVGVLFQPFLKLLDVVQPFGWDWLSLHRHHASSAQMAMACRAISHRGQAVVSESVLAYSRQAGPGSLNRMEAAAAAGSLCGDGVWRAVALPPASFTRRISSRPWRCPGGARPALASSRSAHTRVAGEVASQSAMMAEFMPEVPRVATAGAGLLAARARASARPSATSTGGRPQPWKPRPRPMRRLNL